MNRGYWVTQGYGDSGGDAPEQVRDTYIATEPQRDPCSGYLEVIERLAGKTHCARVATHDAPLQSNLKPALPAVVEAARFSTTRHLTVCK